MHPIEQAAKRIRLAQAELLEPMLKRALRLLGEAAMNDQRVVDVGLLRRAVGLLSTVHPAVVADKLRAIIDGPGVEPVGEVVAFGANLHEVSWKNGKLPPLGTKLYLAAPSTQVQAVPDGWQLINRTPTPEQRELLLRADEFTTGEMWIMLLAAAEHAPQSP